MSEAFNLIAIMQASPGNEAALLEAVKKCAPHSRAEPGCLQYTPHTDPAVPGRILFIERWANKAALDFHAQTPHFLEMMKTAKPLFQTDLQLIFLQEI